MINLDRIKLKDIPLPPGTFVYKGVPYPNIFPVENKQVNIEDIRDFAKALISDAYGTSKTGHPNEVIGHVLTVANNAMVNYFYPYLYPTMNSNPEHIVCLSIATKIFNIIEILYAYCTSDECITFFKDKYLEKQKAKETRKIKTSEELQQDPGYVSAVKDLVRRYSMDPQGLAGEAFQFELTAIARKFNGFKADPTAQAIDKNKLKYLETGQLNSLEIMQHEASRSLAPDDIKKFAMLRLLEVLSSINRCLGTNITYTPNLGVES